LVLGIALSDLVFSTDLVDGKTAGAVEVDVGIEVFCAEGVDLGGEALRNVGVAEDLADDRAVFGFGQSIVVAVSGP
jgi:hypothetical protein